MDEQSQHFAEYLEGLGQQESLKALKQYFLAAITAQGYCAFDAYAIRIDTLQQPRQKDNFCIASYPLEYIYKYVEKGFVAQCAGLAKAGRSRLPFDYLAFLKQQTKTPAVVWQRALYLLNKIHHAWLVPLNNAHCYSGVTVYLQGDSDQHRSRFIRTRHQIHLMASHFFESALSFNPSGVMADLLIDQPAGFETLSTREMDCLSYCAAGKTNREIAQAMSVSENTVRFHMKNIFRKLDVSSRAHAVSKVGGLLQHLAS